MLIDSHGRKVNYLRLAVTDRCNLRCFYCMPENGIKYVLRKDLLSFEEMYRLVKMLSHEGVDKLRITGGEPFVRKGIMEFLQETSKISGINEINVTTNGTFTKSKIQELAKLGINSINLSLDSLNPKRFKEITRRDYFTEVMETYHELLNTEIKVKINMVVMKNKNIDDIYPMIELGKNDNVGIRFIEEMPFNGTLGQGNQELWPMKSILKHISKRYEFEKIPDAPSSTSVNYRVKGYKGTFGIIAAFSRTFCGTCNRIRVTPQGELKTCLYDGGAMSIRDIMRSGADDAELLESIKKALKLKAKDGFLAEKRHRSVNPISESMATIGG
ncbi:MAG: GTP 3',8-cyclase MoaA [Bacteroidia bacterium]